MIHLGQCKSKQRESESNKINENVAMSLCSFFFYLKRRKEKINLITINLVVFT